MKLSQIPEIVDLIENQQVITANAGLSVQDAARIMASKRIGAVIVLEAGTLTGIFTERDVLRLVAEERDLRNTTLSEAMTRNPSTVTLDTEFQDAVAIMLENGFRHLPVIDHAKGDIPDDRTSRLIGMVSSRDFLRHFGARPTTTAEEPSDTDSAPQGALQAPKPSETP